MNDNAIMDMDAKNEQLAAEAVRPQVIVGYDNDGNPVFAELPGEAEATEDKEGN